MMPPCKDCERKGYGEYHSQCPEYKKYKEKLNEARERKIKDIQANDVLLKRRAKRDRL